VTNTVTRIAMWSGPRNLSTAMMRSWENRSDTVVMDEPLYATFLASTGFNHPAAFDVIAAGPADDDSAIAACVAPVPDGISISYQKHMAHHLLPHMDRTWLGEMRNCLLLRDPRRVLASYAKVRAEISLEDIGLPQQIELADRCEVVIDTDDFLHDPPGYLDELCRRLDVTFDGAMLAWPPGPRDSDGIWAPHWYSAVVDSTGFGPPPDAPPDPLPPQFAALTEEAMAIYEGLRVHAMIL
jgi:hypothetical protein